MELLVGELARRKRELSEAKTNYERGQIRERMRELERELEKMSPIHVEIRRREEEVQVEVGRRERKREGILEIEGLSGEKVDVEEKECTEAYIRNSRGIEVSFFRASSSCFLSNVEESRLSFSARQVRLHSCKNLELSLYTRTGIHMEKCEGIEIRAIDGYEEEWGNCLEARDFGERKQV
jgi:Tubulin binding cofactor C